VRVMGVDPGLTRCGLGVVEGTPGKPPALVAVGVIVVIALIAWLSRRANRRIALPLEPSQQRVSQVLSFAPFLTVVFASFVPLAAMLYLAVSTGWTLIERHVMRRALWTAG